MATANLPRGSNLEIFTKQQSGGFKTAASGNYVKTPLYSYGVGRRQPFSDDPILGGVKDNGFDQTEPGPGLVEVGGALVAPLDFAHSGLWLASAFGAPDTSGADSDFVHVFMSGKAVLPERTIERKMQKASGAILLQTVGLLINEVSLQASRQEGYARLSMQAVGYDEVDLGASSGAGTVPDMWARDPIAAALGVYKIDTVAAALLECNVTYQNNLEGRPEIGDARMAGYDPGDKRLTGTLRMRLRDMTLVSAAQAGTSHAGELLFQKSSTRLLSWAMPKVRLERPEINNEGPGGIDVTFNLRAEQTEDAPMLTVTLKGGVDDYSGL